MVKASNNESINTVKNRFKDITQGLQSLHTQIHRVNGEQQKELEMLTQGNKYLLGITEA